MKKFLVIVGVLLTIGLSGAVANAMTAEVQVLHNDGEPAASEVDIYITSSQGQIVLDDFAYRSATPFVTLPAGETIRIGVALSTSVSEADTIKSFNVMFENGKRYLAIANGVTDPLNPEYGPNPDGLDIAFTIVATDGIRKTAPFGGVNVLAFHGVTDAPAVDVRVASRWGLLSLFSDLSYGEFSRYRWLYAKAYELAVTVAGDKNAVVATFEADLSPLKGQAVTVFASGFLGANNINSLPAFGLFALLTDGTVLPLSAEEQLAEVQVIHNSGDPAASAVDVYITSSQGQIKLDDFAYRTATPFVALPANESIRIGVALSTSTSEADTIASFNVMFEAGERYYAVATGIVAGSYDPNPDGRDIGFTIMAQNGIKEEAPFGGVYVNGFHGSTDAPAVDVRLRGTFFSYAFFSDISYGDFGTNVWLLPNSYTIDVTDAANTVVVASYEADLSPLAGTSVFVFASGFLNPAQNGGVAPFGLFVALPDGTVLPLPSAPAPTYDRWALNKEAEESELAAGSVPRDYALNQNYPNPFNPSTTISFALPQSSNVNLTVYNLLGQRLTTLVEGPMPAGTHSVEFDASSYATGVYFYRLKTDEFADVKKMVLAK